MGTVIEADEMKSVDEWLNEQQNQSENENNEAPIDEGEESIFGTDEGNQNVGITFFDVLKMIVATVFVIILLYFILRMINKRSLHFNESQTIQNLGGTSLGTNRSVQLIRVGKRIFLIGVGENVQLLKEFDHEDEIREIIENYNEKMDQMLKPTDLVSRLSKIFQKEKENAEEKSSFSSTFQQQLERISKERKKVYEQLEKKGSDKQ